MKIVSFFIIFNKPSINSPNFPVCAKTFVVEIIFGTFDFFKKVSALFVLKKSWIVLWPLLFAISIVFVGSIPNKLLKPNFLNSSNKEPSLQPISKIKSDLLSLYKSMVFLANSLKLSLICLDIPGV